MRLLKSAIAVALAIASIQVLACSRSDGPAGTADDLTVVSPTFSVSEGEDQRTITTLGTLRNSASDCFSEIVVEVKYFDAKHNLIDTVTQPLYGLVTPGKQEVAFRVRDSAAQPKEAYASQTVRVVSAEPRGGRTIKQPANSKWIEVLASWGPMLLLIGVWVFFMARMKRKDSPQGRSLAMIEQQNSILASQNELLARIAVAIEGKPAPLRTDA